MQPIFVLVRPQMGENIGAAARAMANFGLDRMRLVDPRDGSIAGTLNAGEVYGALVRQAWENGDPGIVFLDRMNAANPQPKDSDRARNSSASHFSNPST